MQQLQERRERSIVMCVGRGRTIVWDLTGRATDMQ